MKGVIYARYSSDNQREESIEGQLRECMEYAERNGITIFSHYIDRALSAKTDHRPEFQRMIKDSHKQLFDVVIVWKLDRFARNRYDSAHYKAILRKNGVKVVSAKEAIAEDSTGILLESLLEGYAEFYSAELSEKVIRGLTDNALKTRYNGGGLPVGYTIDREQHFQIDPITAPLVLEAFTRYDQGATIKQLVDYLNERGLRSQVNRPMRIDVVTRLLHNRRYIGEYRYRDIVKEDAIPAIVPKDLFDRVQERLAKNKKAPARKKARDEEYLLTTKLFCGKCGASMIGESGTSHTGTVHRYYKCATAKKRKGCDKKSVKKEWIEELVVRETMRMVYDDTVMEALADKLVDFQKRENTDIPLLKKQLAETAQGIENLLNAIQQGILTPSTKARLEQLEETKAQLETSLTLAELQKPVISREQFLFWLHRFRSLDMSKPTERRRLIDSFINAIYLYDDKIVLTFNYKDGSKTVSLQDVEGSDLGAATAPARRKRHIVCDEFFHFIAKLIARSFCCSFLPKRTRCTGFAVGRPPCGRHFSPLRNVNFNRIFQKRLIFIRKMDTARGLDYGRYRATGAQFGGERKERAVPLSEQVPASPGGWPNRIYRILPYRRFHSILIKIVSPGVVSRAQAYMPCTTRSG